MEPYGASRLIQRECKSDIERFQTLILGELQLIRLRVNARSFDQIVRCNLSGSYATLA
jgi:hypothetical protein